MQSLCFSSIFKDLTGNDPFPWQSALYERFINDDFPTSANIPTGLGKTSVIAIWLCALATKPDSIPRRLVYVVNRRTVVDQTTTEVKRLRDALVKNPELAEIRTTLASLCALPLPTPDAPPLAISTLRGEFADNGEWCADPSRPAVIAGTVDMIGSGLLFSRYARGFKTRPLHAGFLAQDALLVHDEAHLEPSFQTLLESIVAAQHAANDPRKLRIIELTATSRAATSNSAPPHKLTDDDHKGNDTVKERYHAFKKLSLTALADGEKLDAKLAALAKNRPDGRAELIFARSVETALKIATELDKGAHKGKVATLTGTMRGKERDELVSKPVFQRFLPENDHTATTATGTVFLVATSAGEVGVNLSADDLVCDLSTYDSMAQRFGRVNRFGKRKDTEIIVVHETKFDTEKPIESARERTLALLEELERKADRSASPAALDELPVDKRAAAFSPPPELRVATDIQFDAWALTSIRHPISARPPVAPYLHGEAEWQPPETHVAWRKELDVLKTTGLRNAYPPADLLEDFPLKPHELLRDTTRRVLAAVKTLIENASVPKSADSRTAWLITAGGDVEILALSDFLNEDARVVRALESALADATLILPASLGGIDGKGLLTPSATNDADGTADVADINDQRIRVWSSTPKLPADRVAAGFRLIRTIDTEFDKETADDSDERAKRYWLWLEAKSSGAAGASVNRDAPETLDAHTVAVTANAVAIAAKFFPAVPATSDGEPDLRRCIALAARFHDLGKNRDQWQRNIGNLDYDPAKSETILAKSAPGMRPRNLAEHYRHEFGSLNDASRDAEFTALNDIERDIVLHIVAAHHGRARPYFPAEEIVDYATIDDAPDANTALATETPRRFARLQKRFGRWGLAWLESILRAADYAASAGIVAPTKSSPTNSVHPASPSQAERSPFPAPKEQPAPTATLSLNPANPGHYFACCGLFELAARLSPDAVAWFEQDNVTREWRFHLANTPSLPDLLVKITSSEIRCLDESDNHSAVEITQPFGLRLDWWRYVNRATGKLKTWAGQQGAFSILTALRDEVKNALPTENALNLLEMEATPLSAVSYFDAPRSANATARDVGFSMDKLKKGGVHYENVIHPSVEFLCLIGLQRTRPALLQRELGAEQTYAYYTWRKAITVDVLPVAAMGLFPDSHSSSYNFTNPSRTKDYLAFTPAIIISAR